MAKAPGGRTIEKWNAMCEAFRSLPGNIANCSRMSGVSKAAVSKAWHYGWRNKPWGRKSIKELLVEEQEAARAKRLAMEREAGAREAEQAIAARMDAIQARTEEGALAKASRKNAVNLAVISSKLLVLLDKMLERLRQEVEANTVPVGEIRKWVGTVSVATQRAEAVMRMALEIERIVTGEPIAVLGVRVDKMSPDDMVRELSGLTKTLERAQRLADVKLEADKAVLDAEAAELKNQN
jgi:hypothetical protein